MTLFQLTNINAMHDNSLLTIVSFMILASAIWVVIAWNPVISILNLIVLFGMVSFYLIGLSIMSLLYILIYIGAIAILFLFILSLLNVQYSELTSVSTMRDWPFIFSLLSLLMGYYYFNKNLISLYPFLLNQWSLNLNFFNLNLSLTYLTTWVNFFPINHLSLIGTLLYSKHAIFILAFILLLSIIGAITITLYRKTK